MQKRIKVREVMTPVGEDHPLVGIGEDSKVSDALSEFKKTNRNKIIVLDDNNNPLKSLKLVDVAGEDPNLSLKELDLDDIVKVEEDSDIDDNIRSNLLGHGFVLATKKNKPVGILTANDLSRYWKKVNVDT